MIKKKTEDTIRIDIPLSTPTSPVDTEAIRNRENEKRKIRIRRFLSSFVIALAVCCAISVVVLLYQKRDALSSRNLKRVWNGLWGIELKMDSLNWNLSDTAVFASFEGGIVGCDASGLRIVDVDGIEETLNIPIFSNPCIAVENDRFLLTDQNAHQLVYSNGQDILLSLGENEKIQSAYLSESGVSVITEADGYLSALRAYNRNGKLLMEYKTPDYFGVASWLSNDGKTLLFVGMTSGDTGMDAQVLFIDMKDSAVAYTLDLGETLPVSIRETKNNVFSILSDRAIYSVDDEGNLIGSAVFDGQKLLTYCWSDAHCICLLERHQSGGRYLLNIYDSSSAITAAKRDNRTPNAIAVEEDCVALAYENKVEVYPFTLDSYVDYYYDHYVSKLALSKEGSLIAEVNGTLYLK